MANAKPVERFPPPSPAPSTPDDKPLTAAEKAKLASLSPGPPTWDDVQNKPATFPPAVHTHPPPTWDDVASKPSTFPVESHTHAIGDVTNLQTTLDGKAATGHTHADLHTRQHSITAVGDHTFPGGTTDFLRADGTFATPPVGSGSDPFVFKGVLASPVSTAANTTPVNVTGLVFTFLPNSTYVVEVFGRMQSPAATTGYGLQLDTSVAVTAVGLTFFHQLANTGTITGGSSIADDASTGVSSGVPSANVVVPLYAAGVLVSGANGGTAQLRLRSETTAIATMAANSVMRVQKV